MLHFHKVCWARSYTAQLWAFCSAPSLLILSNHSITCEDAVAHSRQPARLNELMQPCRLTRLRSYQGIQEDLHPAPPFWMDHHCGIEWGHLLHSVHLLRSRTDHGEAKEAGIQHPDHRLFHPSQFIGQRFCRQDNTRCTMVVPQSPL